MKKFRVVDLHDNGVFVIAAAPEDILKKMGIPVDTPKTEGFRWKKYKLSEPISYTFASGLALRFNVSLIIEDMGPIDVFEPMSPNLSKSEAPHEEDTRMLPPRIHLPGGTVISRY